MSNKSKSKTTPEHMRASMDGILNWCNSVGKRVMPDEYNMVDDEDAENNAPNSQLLAPLQQSSSLLRIVIVHIHCH